MYHLFVLPEQIEESHIYITDSDVNHIENVLRMRPGEQVLVDNGVGENYHCEIDEVSPEGMTARILSINEEGTKLPAKLYSSQGLLKSDKMELTVQEAAELGVHQVIPVMTKWAVMKLDAEEEKVGVKRWNSTAESTAKQSKRLTIPGMVGVMGLSETSTFTKNLDVNLIPFEYAEGMAGTREEPERIGPGESVGVFIGSEGGFEDSEIEAVCEADTRPATLGKRILRAETVGLVILSILMLQLED